MSALFDLALNQASAGLVDTLRSWTRYPGSVAILDPLAWRRRYKETLVRESSTWTLFRTDSGVGSTTSTVVEFDLCHCVSWACKSRWELSFTEDFLADFLVNFRRSVRLDPAIGPRTSTVLGSSTRSQGARETIQNWAQYQVAARSDLH
jgi:hypothetical protein